MQPTPPRHVAIIMDGNGRWAERQGLPRIKGHEVGVQRVEEITRLASKYGVKYLTLYAFSKENWQRPGAEVSFLMGLLSHYLDKSLADFKKDKVRFRVIGRTSDLPADIQKKIARNTAETQHFTENNIIVALSYSSRLEIVDACRKIAEKTAAGILKPEAITEDTLADNLYTAGVPDPDLLIRTSGEMRVSNFLLWQISYTELYVTEKLWPEFGENEFQKAILDFQKRERRFGKVGI